MVTIINHRKASVRMLAPLLTHCRAPLPQHRIPVTCYYEINHTQASESTMLLFVQNRVTKESAVIKILREYKDVRYSLATRSERQQCQLEALRWNRVFTPDVYIGLAPICDLELRQKMIGIGKVIEHPSANSLDPNADYVLLMRQLPMDRRLDFLLSKEHATSREHYIRLLAKRIGQIHIELETLPFEDQRRWGSFEQIQQKLLYNFSFEEKMLAASKQSQSISCKRLKDLLSRLKEKLLHILAQGQYEHYFNQRIEKQYIKRCHGDLKTLNILIAPYESSSDRELSKHVWILDAIDFNPMYCNIDILSDVAMLLVDIQARTKSLALIDQMIETYLELTRQDDEVSRAVLAYYLVEKALVGAIMNIVYEKLPGLGWDFLKLAEMRLQSLGAMNHCLVF